MKERGFTLIELLIVITIIGVLAVAVLSAIDPIEQIKKANDSRRKSDTAEFLNALERYYTTFEVFPATLTTTATCPHFTNPDTTAKCNGLNMQELITKKELKASFAQRPLNEYLVSGSADEANVCYKPESNTFLAKATRTNSNSDAGASGNYACVPE